MLRDDWPEIATDQWERLETDQDYKQGFLLVLSNISYIIDGIRKNWMHTSENIDNVKRPANLEPHEKSD